MLIAVKQETSIRFTWEDWNERSRKGSSKARKRQSESSVRRQQHTPAAQTRVPTSTDQEDGGRSTLKALHSTSDHARSVQMSAEQLNATIQAAEPQPAARKRTTCKRLPAKSVQSRGTQLDSTPVPSAGSPLGIRTPRQLKEIPLKTARLVEMSADPQTACKRLPAKSVKSRGTQLDSTPVPADGSPLGILTPRQLEEMQVETACLADMSAYPQQLMDTYADDTAGNNVEIKQACSVLVYCVASKGRGRSFI